MKLLIQKWGVTLYLLILSIHLYAQLFGFYPLQVATKLLLLPLLMLYLAMQDYKVNLSKGKYFIIIGLLGSFLGDALLLSEKYFIFGMVAFMTTHIFNILFLNSLHSFYEKRSKKWWLFLLTLLFFCVFIYQQLQEKLGTLIFPILIYMVLICCTLLKAVHVSSNAKVKDIANLFWIPGMLFFITSDAVLAFNKFKWSLDGPVPYIGLITMLTYGMAQLLLVKGFQLYFTKNKE